MRIHFKTGTLVATTNNSILNIIRKHKIVYRYQEKFCGNTVIKTIISK